MAFFHSTRTKSEPADLLQHYYVEVLQNSRFMEALHAYDVAHVVALRESGLVTDDIAKQLLTGLIEMQSEGVMESRKELSLGGVHSAEDYLRGKYGESVSGWIHIGRSSPTNRSVATRILARELILDQLDNIIELEEALVVRATEYAGVVMPTYAYLNPLEVSTFGHYLLSHVYTLQRVWDTFELGYHHTNESASSAEVGAGSYFAVDLELESRLLGFDRIGANAREIIRHFDYLLMVFYAVAMAGNSVARLGQDLRAFSTKEFDLVTLGPEYAISSSVAVQSKIPYSPGMLSATGGGLLLGRLTGAFAMTKTTSDEPFVGTELIRDLLNSCEELENSLHIATGSIRTMEANPIKMEKQAAEQGTQATAIIALLIQKAGVSYRAAYQAVGATMNELEANGNNILSMKVGNLNEHLRQRSGVEVSFGQSELDFVLNVTNCANMKVSPGSSGQKEIEKMINDCLGVIDQHKSSVMAKREKINLGSEEMYERVNAIIS